jgi:hypothetical protein
MVAVAMINMNLAGGKKWGKIYGMRELQTSNGKRLMAEY